MRLRILTPAHVVVDEPVSRVRIESINGSYSLLPRHIDFITALVPGIVVFQREGEGEKFAGIDQGILVKEQENVRLAVRRGVVSSRLGEIRSTVDEQYRELSKREKKAQASWARLESDFVRSIIQFEKPD